MPPGFTARAVKTKGPNFSHPPPGRPGQLSPRSSNTSMPSDSDSDSESSDSDAEPAPRRAGSLSPTHHHTASSPPPPVQARFGRTVHNPALVIEELSDFRDSDYELPGIIRPVAIEDAESDHGQSRSRRPPEGYLKVVKGMGELNCGGFSDDSDIDFDESEYQEFLRKSRAAKRHRRMTAGSIGKRTITESLGSDSDHEDLNKPYLSVEEAGSSARRLRRKIGNRHSLQFHDPPPGIAELDEPNSSEDEMLVSEALARELPYYEYSVMEIDSPQSPHNF